MFIKRKKYLRSVLNKRQKIRCKTQYEAIKLMEYLSDIGFYERTMGGIVDLPVDGYWNEFKDKTVYEIVPSSIYGYIHYGSIDTVHDKEMVINFSDLF